MYSDEELWGRWKPPIRIKDEDMPDIAERTARKLDYFVKSGYTKRITTELIIEAFAMVDDAYDDYWGRGLNTEDKEIEFFEKLIPYLKENGINNIVNNTHKRNIVGTTMDADMNREER